jgi:uncharacterized membrane protein
MRPVAAATTPRTRVAPRRAFSRLASRFFALCVALVHGILLLPALSKPGYADFRVCNNTESRVGVALGYKDGEVWVTEGWWNLSARTCETLLTGRLVSRFYYVHAVDYDQGGEWGGRSYMCTRDKEFAIRGIGDCLTRGYERTGFFEIDTGEQASWTIQLAGTLEAGARAPRPAFPPLTPGLPPAAAPTLTPRPPLPDFGSPTPQGPAR